MGNVSYTPVEGANDARRPAKQETQRPVTTPKPDHDALYHRFFSDPAIVAQLLREFVAGPWHPDVRVPEQLLEVRNMLLAQMEAWRVQWKQQMRQQLEQEWQLESERRGKVTLLLRLLEHRFGVLPDWARDRVRAADTVTIEEWGLRVLEAASLDEVLA